MEKSKKREILEFIGNVLLFFVIFFLLRKYVALPVKVQGASMNYTLEDGQQVIASPLAKIDHSDVVIFDAPDNPDRMYVKRVIGLPGDTVEYKNDELYLNGELVEEPYLEQGKEEFVASLSDDFKELPEPLQPKFTSDFTLEEVTGEAVVPEGKAFCLGDNRRNSHDGRNYGFVDISELDQVVFRHWPLSKFGPVK